MASNLEKPFITLKLMELGVGTKEIKSDAAINDNSDFVQKFSAGWLVRTVPPIQILSNFSMVWPRAYPAKIRNPHISVLYIF